MRQQALYRIEWDDKDVSSYYGQLPETLNIPVMGPWGPKAVAYRVLTCPAGTLEIRSTWVEQVPPTSK